MKKIMERPLIVVHLGKKEQRMSVGSLVHHKNKLNYSVQETVLDPELRSAYYDAFYYVRSKLSEKDVKKNLKRSYPVIAKLLKNVIKEKGYSFSDVEMTKIIYYLYRDLIGFGVIESLYAEPDITFISCAGLGKPVYAYHQDVGFVETNISFLNRRRLRSLVWRMLKKCDKLDSQEFKGILPDGSFISTNDSFGFQIRKTKVKFKPEFIIKNKMGTPAAFAFIDSLVDHGKSILIVGPKKSGKTAFLSGILHMINKNKRIRIVEHKPHIVIDNMNWNSTVINPEKNDSRHVIEKYLKAKPDYIVVDELGEKDAKGIIQSLKSNPGILTLEAGNTDVAINRLVNRFKVPKSYLANIDIIIMFNHMRNIEEILEIHKYDKKINELKAKVVFRKERGRLKALESRFMRSLSASKKQIMERKAKLLHTLSKK